MPVAVLGAKLEISGPLAAAIDKRTFGAVLKAGHADMALFWHAKKLAKHFTEAGAAEYGYRPRSLKYLRRKRRKLGHVDPNVWSGDTKRNVLARSGARVSSTSKSATITLRRGRGFKHARLAKELATVSVRDKKACAKHLQAYAAKKLNMVRVVRRVNV